MTVLYFPAEDIDVPSSIGLVFAGNALFGGTRRPPWVHTNRWVELPFIYEPDFTPTLMEMVELHKITTIMSRHPASILKFRATKELTARGVELISYHPSEVIDVAAEQAGRIKKEVLDLFGLGHDHSHMSIVALSQILDGVVGATSTSKAWALNRLAARPQTGAIVEVGVLFGKSAFPLALGARESGALFVAVDTWDNDAAVQRDSPEILEEAAHSWNRDHMQAIAQGLIEFAGCRSLVVRGDTSVALKRLGEIDKGSVPQVSLLHIDANHDFEKVKSDWELWQPLLTPDHVVVFDDTSWAAGDGPRRLVDSIIDSGVYENVVNYQGSTFLWGIRVWANRARSLSVNLGPCRGPQSPHTFG